MTLFGFCPECGYPWYCMCEVCEPNAPRYVKAWIPDYDIPDVIKCPNCGQSYNYDIIADICENQNILIDAMKEVCNKCTSNNCGDCSIVRFTKTTEWFGEELLEARLKGISKTCSNCWNALCRFFQNEDKSDCNNWTPIDERAIRRANMLKAKQEE